MPARPEADEDVPVVQSVDRAMAALEILAREEWAGVTEIADELDIHKSTVFRLLSTLQRRDVVEQSAETQRYRLGFGLVGLAASVRSSLDVVRAGRSVCDRLSVATDEAVNIAVLQGRLVVNIHQVNHSQSRIGIDWLGSHADLHCTSTGKVLLADRHETIDELLPEELDRYTPNTITDRRILEEQLEMVRRDGYATTVEELEEGLNAVAAPIHGVDGRVVASVSVSGPSYRLQGDVRRRAAELTRQAAQEISRRLGSFDDPES